MKKSELITLVKEILAETSATGTGASTTAGDGMGVATKFAFKKKTKQKPICEVSSRDYNKQVSATPKQKANNAYRLVRKKLNEIDAILAYSSRLKEELGSSWTLNEKQLMFVQEKMKSLTGKLKTLTK